MPPAHAFSYLHVSTHLGLAAREHAISFSLDLHDRLVGFDLGALGRWSTRSTALAASEHSQPAKSGEQQRIRGSPGVS